MKKFLLTLLVFFILIPTPIFSWDGNDHQLMTRLALTSVSEEWNLTTPCDIHPLKDFLQKLGTLRHELSQPWYFSDFLKINPAIDMEIKHADLKDKNRVTPLEILSSYATEPDEGRDENIFFRDANGKPRPMFADQPWFGSLQGAGSKSFRHLQKPAFSWHHPVSTFGFPLRTLGEASTRAEIYYQLSLLAFSFHEDYWGWRFLANGLHYIEDLTQPYHTGQITPKLVIDSLIAYLQWGHKNKSLIETAAHLVSNSHRFYESYVARPGDGNQASRQKLLKALEEKTLLPSSFNSGKEMALFVRDYSNQSWPSLVACIGEIMSPRLKGPYDFVTETEPRDNPSHFLNKQKDFDQKNETVFQITENQYHLAGQAIRTIVKLDISTKQGDPKKILEVIDQLLQEYPVLP